MEYKYIVNYKGDRAGLKFQGFKIYDTYEEANEILEYYKTVEKIELKMGSGIIVSYSSYDKFLEDVTLIPVKKQYGECMLYTFDMEDNVFGNYPL